MISKHMTLAFVALLVLLLAAPSLASGSPRQLHKRQSPSVTGPASAIPSTTTTPTSSEIPTTQPSSSASSTSASAPPVSTLTPSSQSSSQASSSVPSSSSSTPTPTSTPFVTSVEPQVSTSVVPFTVTHVTTVSGTPVTSIATTSTAQVYTTGFSTVTRPAASIQTNSPTDSGSGLSDTSKKTIGGVVGGVGGAILLGGIAWVLWRVYGRKKSALEDTMYQPYAAPAPVTAQAPHPDSNGLDRYAQPGGSTTSNPPATSAGSYNTSSNF